MLNMPIIFGYAEWHIQLWRICKICTTIWNQCVKEYAEKYAEFVNKYVK